MLWRLYEIKDSHVVFYVRIIVMNWIMFLKINYVEPQYPMGPYLEMPFIEVIKVR